MENIATQTMVVTCALYLSGAFSAYKMHLLTVVFNGAKGDKCLRSLEAVKIITSGKETT